uniref:F-box domain-containing protein n=1 Tax=Setaria viridis TaxID=4556 RepID=A0A4U6U9C3_SETVI|nr:hypothetical protein SEVIR_6G201500v2 [Setaria viridis]
MAYDGSCLPDDVLVQILLLIPASSRRPLRLVCKGWRNVIDESAPPEENLPRKILVFMNQGRSCSALVFDGSGRHRTHAWAFTSSSDEGRVHMVGTCNGLLCLHDHTTYGGISFSAVTVTNPVTGETVALPPVPTRWAWSQFAKGPGKYSFGFHPETKLHKVVHIPRGQRRSVDAVQVFTLGAGGKAWREVPPVSVGGSTYWLAAASSGSGTGRVMALDLGDERVTSLDAPPAMGPAPTRSTARDTWRLTKVRASLGVMVSSVGMSLISVDVWVLDGGGAEKPQWERRYSVAQTAWSSWVMAPQLTHGDWILSASRDEWNYTSSWRRKRQLHRHKVGELTDSGGTGRQLPPPKGAQLIMSTEECECEFTTFAYVETLNPVPRSK